MDKYIGQIIMVVLLLVYSFFIMSECVCVIARDSLLKSEPMFFAKIARSRLGDAAKLVVLCVSSAVRELRSKRAELTTTTQRRSRCDE